MGASSSEACVATWAMPQNLPDFSAPQPPVVGSNLATFSVPSFTYGPLACSKPDTDPDPNSFFADLIADDGSKRFFCSVMPSSNFPRTAPDGTTADSRSSFQFECDWIFGSVETSGDYTFRITNIDLYAHDPNAVYVSSNVFTITVDDPPPPPPVPTGEFFRVRRARIRSAREQARLGVMQTSIPLTNGGHVQCPTGHNACPVMGKLEWECVDLMSDLDNCGGCEGSINARDCTAIEGAEDVTCISGQCRVWSCDPGYTVGNDGTSCRVALGYSAS